jgi:hypothetical protein
MLRPRAIVPSVCEERAAVVSRSLHTREDGATPRRITEQHLGTYDHADVDRLGPRRALTRYASGIERRR